MRKMTASAISGTAAMAWADQLVNVVLIASVLLVVVIGLAIWAWCLGPKDRSIDDLVKLLRVPFDRGRDPDPNHPPDRGREPG